MKPTRAVSFRTIGRRAGALLAAALALAVGLPGAANAGPAYPAAPRAAEARLEVPDHLKPGEHTLEFTPVAQRSLARITVDKAHTGPVFDSSDPLNLEVGWHGRSDLNDLRVSQTAVTFELGRLFEVGRPIIGVAHLHFDEVEIQWRDNDFEETDVVGCVTSVGFATNDWSLGLPPPRFASADGLFRSRLASDGFLEETTTGSLNGRTIRGRTADVAQHIRGLVNNPDGREEWFGYVLSGGKEKESSARGDCMSKVLNMRLSITYVVPASSAGTAVEPSGPPPDLAIEKIRGREEVEGGVGKTMAYLVVFRNDGADANGTVVVDIATSGVLTLAEDPEVAQTVQKGWEASGFKCVTTQPSGGANASMRCSGGSLKRGQSANPAVIVRATRAGYGYIHASIGVSGGPPERDTSDQGLALPVRIY